MIDEVIVVREIRADFGRVDVGDGMLEDRECGTKAFSRHASLDLKKSECIHIIVEQDALRGGKQDGWWSDKMDLEDIGSEGRRVAGWLNWSGVGR